MEYSHQKIAFNGIARLILICPIVDQMLLELFSGICIINKKLNPNFQIPFSNKIISKKNENLPVCCNNISTIVRCH